MRIKVCGITSLVDAEAAVEAGADALGFIFAEASPRYIKPAAARSIIQQLSPFVTTVGVFVNSPRASVLDIVQTTGIQAIQFHGEESPEDLENYRLPVYKAFRVDSSFDLEVLKRYKLNTFLLDAYDEGVYGGTGKTFNWEIAVAAKRFGNVILSGGLSADNIAEAVRVVQPYAVDVNSGVESSPGKKDKQKLREFFSALRTIQEYACS